MKNYEIIPDYISSSLAYAYENSSNINNGKEIILMIEMGYINTNCTLIRYCKNKMTIINTISYKIGGRDIDKLLIEYIYEKMKKEEENVNDLDKDTRLYWKIEDAVINCKEKLSADGAASVLLTVDSYYNDEDFQIELSCDEIKNIIHQNYIDKNLINIINGCYSDDELEDGEKELLNVLIIGGSLRIPYLKQVVLDYLKDINGKTQLKQTLNMNECNSLGCSYYYKMKSGEWNYQIIDTRNKFNETYLIKEFEEVIIKTYEEEKNMESKDKYYADVLSYHNKIEAEMYILYF